MQDLPDELLQLMARQVLERKDGLRLWCKLASTCRRLWSFQLPPEPAYFLDDSLTDLGVEWAIKRLWDARKLNLTVGNFIRGQHKDLHEASQRLSKLDTLALSTWGIEDIAQRCQHWVRALLLGASSLTVLKSSLNTLPWVPVLQHLPLRHLELNVSLRNVHKVHDLFADGVSSCLTLESLKCVGDWHSKAEETIIRLPSMQLHGMPSLQHVRFEECIPGHAFSLPAGSALFLDVACGDKLWLEQEEKFREHSTVLRYSMSGYKEWPPGILGFSHLQYLELSTSQELIGQNLADLQHIPNVKLVLDSGDELDSYCDGEGGEALKVTGGSWSSLEIFDFGELHLTISDADSFVRDSGSFTLMSKITSWEYRVVFREVRAACRRHGKACHVVSHRARMFGEGVRYITLSTSKEVAQDNPEFCDDCEDTLEYMMGEEPDGCEGFTEAEKENYQSAGFASDKTLVDWDAFWPCSPFTSVTKPIGYPL